VVSGQPGQPQMTGAPPPPPQMQMPTDSTVQMMLARAMSIPLATVLFQSLMGNQQMPATAAAFPAPPPMQPMPSQPLQPMQAQSPVMQMMQQVFQGAAAAPQPPVSGLLRSNASTKYKTNKFIFFLFTIYLFFAIYVVVYVYINSD